ncbi:unnamed protein product [Porites lobata]|uniref:Uncharacterized protein n=1 Tax=Porites lobata TaxID=104759 RepID=A0ABN8N6G0_9CNID|nr:unnamed protein product [Porites lobata]
MSTRTKQNCGLQLTFPIKYRTSLTSANITCSTFGTKFAKDSGSFDQVPQQHELFCSLKAHFENFDYTPMKIVSSLFIPWEASKQRALEIRIPETHILRQGEDFLTTQERDKRNWETPIFPLREVRQNVLVVEREIS